MSCYSPLLWTGRRQLNYMLHKIVFLNIIPSFSFSFSFSRTPGAHSPTLEYNEPLFFHVELFFHWSESRGLRDPWKLVPYFQFQLTSPALFSFYLASFATDFKGSLSISANTAIKGHEGTGIRDERSHVCLAWTSIPLLLTSRGSKSIFPSASLTFFAEPNPCAAHCVQLPMHSTAPEQGRLLAASLPGFCWQGAQQAEPPSAFAWPCTKNRNSQGFFSRCQSAPWESTETDFPLMQKELSMEKAKNKKKARKYRQKSYSFL